MLAPLKNRALLERDQASPQTDLSYLTPADRQYLQHLEAENESFRLALRQARRSQRRSASLAARQVVAQLNEINRLADLNSHLKKRLEAFESGQVIIELGRKLVELSEANDSLNTTAQRVWFLEKTICAAHAECERLYRERDEARFSGHS